MKGSMREQPEGSDLSNRQISADRMSCWDMQPTVGAYRVFPGDLAPLTWTACLTIRNPPTQTFQDLYSCALMGINSRTRGSALDTLRLVSFACEMRHDR
jgi:hypothetical protein